MIKAVLSSPQHPEYGEVTVSSPISRKEYDDTMELLEGLDIGDVLAQDYWFAENIDGPWEWRMEAARRGVVAYGKLFSKKAGLVSREWYPDLANYRRNGYGFDSRYEEGLAGYREKCVMDVLLREGPTLSEALKRLAGFGGDGLKGFDTVITSLQMQTYVTVHSFEYAHDKYGKPYGWGIARYAVTEDVLGAEVTQGAYGCSPEKSRATIVQHLGMLCPDAFDDDLERLIRWNVFVPFTLRVDGIGL